LGVTEQRSIQVEGGALSQRTLLLKIRIAQSLPLMMKMKNYLNTGTQPGFFASN